MPKNVQEKLENGEENLDEFKADHSPSEISDPVSKDAKSPEDDSDPHKEGTHLKKVKDEKGKKSKTKASMMKDSLDVMKDMDPDELAELHAQIVKKFEESDDVEDIDDEDEDDDDMDMKKKKDEKYNKKKMEAKKVTKEDIDGSQDVTAMLGENEDLSDEFKQNAQTVFEASVVSTVNKKLAEMAEVYDEDLENRLSEAVDELTKRVNEFLEYAIDEWMEENEVAIENGLRLEITESALAGMKKVFEDHMIEVPENKIDVFEELAESNEELKTELNEQIEKNIELMQENVDLRKQDLIDEACQGLVETQKDKLRSLAEAVDFEDEDNFKEKVKTLRSQYFGEGEEGDDTNTLIESIDGEGVDTDDDEFSEQNNIDPAVKATMNYLSNSSRK